MNLDITATDLYVRCVEEVSSPDHDPTTHGVDGTYRNGCRGPICTYARSTSRSGGSPFLSNDIIEYLSVYFWLAAQTDAGVIITVLEAPRRLRIFYARLKERGLAGGLEDNRDLYITKNYPQSSAPAA